MKTAELIGIDEKELRGFLIALPELYNSKTRIYESGIEPILSKFIDCEKKLTCTHLFNFSLGIMIIFTEYLKEEGAATFEFHALIFPLGVTRTVERAEKRLREIILSFTDKDMASFREIPTEETFICPACHARYSFRSLKISEDGLTQCQNCGKYVHTTKYETPSDTDMTVIDDDESKH